MMLMVSPGRVVPTISHAVTHGAACPRSGAGYASLILMSRPDRDPVLRVRSPGDAGHEAGSTEVKVLLDTDIGGDFDDANALALLALSPEVDLVTVTTVGAGASARRRADVARNLLSAAGGGGRMSPGTSSPWRDGATCPSSPGSTSPASPIRCSTASPRSTASTRGRPS